jgi:hypothetical protein
MSMKGGEVPGKKAEQVSRSLRETSNAIAAGVDKLIGLRDRRRKVRKTLFCPDGSCEIREVRENV